MRTARFAGTLGVPVAFSPALPLPGQRARFLLLALALFVLLVGFLVWANAPYLFHARLYEEGDPAANSLSVLRAARGQELYGAYSRWGFHHPGPALFYTLAGGEWLFYRVLRLVPTPYNAQTLTVLLVTGGFFAAGLAVAARWVGGRVFAPLALAFAAWHFTAADPCPLLLTPWTAYVLAMPFFALLMAAASVGAGQGDDLPLLVLAGGFAVHLHLAQPLFAGPLALLAGAGLWRAHGAPPWRRFPRAHAWAALLLAAFLLPLAADLCRGPQSNFAAVLAHLRLHRAERRHPWAQAFSCFLRFGAYLPSREGSNAVSPQPFTGADLGRFLRGHLQMTLLWLGALAAPALAFALRRRGGAAADRANPARAARGRFLGWLAAVWGMAAALTVLWNRLQDGEMYYFNSWFAYAVYLALAVLAAGALSDLAENLAARARQPGRWTALAAALCLLGAGVHVSRHLGRWRARDYDDAGSRAVARTVADALAARPGTPRAKRLAFPQSGWGAATAVAALLARGDHPCFVPAAWEVMFGPDHVRAEGEGAATEDLWRIVPARTLPPASAGRFPLCNGCALLPGAVELDPAGDGAAVTFAGERANAACYVRRGWALPDDPAAPYAWSESQSGWLDLAPRRVSADAAVEVTLRFTDICLPADGRGAQRLVMLFNGHPLGPLRADGPGPGALCAVIPAPWWNERPEAVLACGFPDAVSPRALGESADTRPLAFATESITFRTRPAPAASDTP